MKEIGIIMSGEHPKLILDRIKTQTRRTWGLEVINLHPDSWHLVWNEGDLWAFSNEAEQEALTLKCPYGQVGDRLWVRETWRILDNTMLLDVEVRVEYKADGHIIKRRYSDIIYNEAGIRLPVIDSAMEDGKWKPAHHLPHVIYRIPLEITEVRAERLQEITEKDAFAEGCRNQVLSNMAPNFDIVVRPASEVFSELWDSLNAKRGYPWLANHWVWPISFKEV